MNGIYIKRREALRKCMVERGVQKALIGKPQNIFYLTGININPYERFLGLLMDVESQSLTIILPSLDKGAGKKNGLFEVLINDNEHPVHKLVNLFGDSHQIGIEMAYFPMSLGDHIRKYSNKVELIDISSEIDCLRIYKDADEIEKICAAARISDLILGQAEKSIRPGRREKEILFELLEGMSEQPGVIIDSFIIQVLSGDRSANPHGSAGDRKFQKGDPVTIDFGVNYEHYWSDCSRTFFVGKPDPRLEEIYKVVLEAQLAAIEKVRPGVLIKDIDITARQVIENAGFGKFFIHRTGHGIGIDIHEDPKVHGENEGILKAGMVFTIEPGIYIPQLGGVRIEDDIVVTENGYLIPNKYPKEFQDMVLDYDLL